MKETSREYPVHPIPGVAALIFYNDSVLLVSRGNEPSKGRWGLPGGIVELGETVDEAVAREIREETGIEIQPLKLITVFDSITRDDLGKVRFHYILFEFLCQFVGGDLIAGSDVGQARWVRLDDLDSVDIMTWTKSFIEKVRSELRTDLTQNHK